MLNLARELSPKIKATRRTPDRRNTVSIQPFRRLWLSSADDALKDHLSLQGIKSAATGD